MKNKTCGECKYHIGTRCHLPKETFIVMPEIEACRHFTQKPKPTNGDKIRQMSDAELAEKFVYYASLKSGRETSLGWLSTITGDRFYYMRDEAIAATVAELKKEYKENE
jgi:ribosomal protein L29